MTLPVRVVGGHHHLFNLLYAVHIYNDNFIGIIIMMINFIGIIIMMISNRRSCRKSIYLMLLAVVTRTALIIAAFVTYMHAAGPVGPDVASSWLYI